MSTQTTIIENGITTDTCSSALLRNATSLVYSKTLTADPGFHFDSEPSYNITSANFTVVKSGQTHNSDNQLTGIKFDFFYTIGSTDVEASEGEKITFNETFVSADRVNLTRITGAFFVKENSENIRVLNSNESTSTLKVVGNEGATYTITIEDTLGLTYDFSTDTFTRSLTFSSEQRIESAEAQVILRKKAGINEHRIIIPEYFPSSTAEFNYTVTVQPTGNTKSNPSGTSAEPIKIIASQLGKVNFTFSVAESTYGTTAASAQIKALTSKKAMLNLTTFNPSELPALNASNNGYFTYSQVLSYSSTTTTNAAVAGGRTVALDATTAALKLRVGDSITGTNIAEGTTIATLPGGSNIVMSADVSSYPLIDETTLTFTRTIGITRQPTIGDVRTTSPITSSNGILSHLNYSVTNSSFDSKTLELGGLNVSDLSIGMLAKGDNIVGFPKIETVLQDSVILSTKQSLSKDDSVVFSVSDALLYISSINVTGAGTASPKLNVIGYVERVGIESVLAEVVLSNFISEATYGTVVAVAGTATCVLSGAVKISPLTENQTLSGLTISAITSSGNGTTVLSSDSKSIKYLAPATGTTDTISYKVTDGVTTSSAAADIVITLTP